MFPFFHQSNNPSPVIQPRPLNCNEMYMNPEIIVNLLQTNTKLN